MEGVLYKVSVPREDPTFEPTRFWRTEDWSSSTEHPREGHLDGRSYIEDQVLFAAEFDEVNIHLLPKVWRLRVWLDDETRSERLRALGFTWRADANAVIFTAEVNRDAIEAFVPTVFTFSASGFQRTPSNEFISREPRTAVTQESLPFLEAMTRWRFELAYVSDTGALEQSLRHAGIDHHIQT